MKPVISQPKIFHNGLAALRGVAAICVVFYHSALAFRVGDINDGYLLPFSLVNYRIALLNIFLMVFNGPACVTLFFVLSGLVRSMSISRDVPISIPMIAAYWIKRFFRLAPLLIFATFLATFLQIVLFRPEIFDAATTWFNKDYKYHGFQLLTEVLKNAFAITSSLNSPAWSIRIELVASAIFPLLYFLSRRRLQSVVTLCILLTLMFIIREQRLTSYMNVYTICFFSGALIQSNPETIKNVLTRTSFGARLIISFGTLIMFCCSRRLISPGNLAPSLPVLLETISAVWFISLIYYGTNGISTIDVIKRRLGELSYSLYLLHIPVLFVLVHLSLRIAGNPEGVLWLASTIALATTTLIISMPLADSVYRWFERPLERFGRRAAGKLNAKVAKAPVGSPVVE